MRQESLQMTGGSPVSVLTSPSPKQFSRATICVCLFQGCGDLAANIASLVVELKAQIRLGRPMIFH